MKTWARTNTWLCSKITYQCLLYRNPPSSLRSILAVFLLNTLYSQRYLILTKVVNGLYSLIADSRSTARQLAQHGRDADSRTPKQTNRPRCVSQRPIRTSHPGRGAVCFVLRQILSCESMTLQRTVQIKYMAGWAVSGESLHFRASFWCVVCFLPGTLPLQANTIL